MTPAPTNHRAGGCSRSPRFVWWLQLALFGVAGAVGSAMGQPDRSIAADTSGLGIEVGTALRHSEWHEHDAGGARLVTERGTLHGLWLRARREVAWNERLRGSLSVQASLWRGQRDYAGQTSRGQAVAATTLVHESHVEVEAGLALSDALAATASLAPAQVRRDLQASTQAHGYPESWRWTLAMVGLRWAPRRADGDLALHAAWGRPLDARMTVWLPDRDPTRLRPAAGDAWQVELAWRHRLPRGPVVDHWLALTGGWCRIDFGASAPAAVTSGGAVVGAAAQPATRLQDRRVGLAWQARW